LEAEGGDGADAWFAPEDASLTLLQAGPKTNMPTPKTTLAKAPQNVVMPKS
jgi:hypothetical protein